MFFPGNQNSNLREDIISRLEKTNVICRQLVQIWQKIRITKQAFFAEHDLKTFGIQLSNFDLESSTPTKDTRFYKPLSELPNIDWDKVQFSEWTEGYIEESRRINITFLSLSNRLSEACFKINTETPFAYWKYLMVRPAVGTGEHTPDVPYEWQTHSDVEAKSTNLSHCIFRISNYTDPQEHLSRSELIAIVTYMKWRMVQVKHIQHYLFPILVISIFRSKARIIQAYHNGEFLLISKSKFYDFRENSRRNYELFIKWVYSVPYGDTMTPITSVGETLDNVMMEQVDRILQGRQYT